MTHELEQFKEQLRKAVPDGSNPIDRAMNAILRYMGHHLQIGQAFEVDLFMGRLGRYLPDADVAAISSAITRLQDKGVLTADLKFTEEGHQRLHQ